MSYQQDPLEVVVDKASALPSLESIIHDVRILLHTNGYLGVVVIDLEPLSGIESECGSANYNQLLRRIGEELSDIRKQVIRSGDLLCSQRQFGEQLLIFLDGPRESKTLDITAIDRVADRIWHAIAPRITEITRPFGGQGRFRLGYSLTMPNSMIQAERLIYRAIDQAKAMASEHAHRIDTRSRERLRDVIVQGKLTSVFQPIIQMPGNSVKAYEALIRGPAGTDLSSPATLFSLAHHAGLVAELDRACAICNFSSAARLPEGALLFANVVPNLINDASFREWAIAQAKVVGPNRVVLEINEGVAIRNYEFLSEGIAALREGGIRVAVDDLGAGYANLDHVLKLNPDFLKLDISLIRGVHQSSVKRALIASMLSVGKAANATVIAEGVEELAEYQALVDLGVPWGQGYLFARPAPGFPVPGKML